MSHILNVKLISLQKMTIQNTEKISSLNIPSKTVLVAVWPYKMIWIMQYFRPVIHFKNKNTKKTGLLYFYLFISEFIRKRLSWHLLYFATFIPLRVAYIYLILRLQSIFPKKPYRYVFTGKIHYQPKHFQKNCPIDGYDTRINTTNVYSLLLW